MITWPVTIEGILSPAFGVGLNQYEFKCSNGNVNKLRLPLLTGNPYIPTVEKGRKVNPGGILIRCKFGDNKEVKGRFHRYGDSYRYKANRIWIYKNSENRCEATDEWSKFMLLFGVTVGETDKEIPIYLDFYFDTRVEIRWQ